jgi:hypothetical protein
MISVEMIVLISSSVTSGFVSEKPCPCRVRDRGGRAHLFDLLGQLDAGLEDDRPYVNTIFAQQRLDLPASSCRTPSIR